MASPSYGIDVVALAFAVILAAALALLLSRLLPQLADISDDAAGIEQIVADAGSPGSEAPAGRCPHP